MKTLLVTFFLLQSFIVLATCMEDKFELNLTSNIKFYYKENKYDKLFDTFMQRLRWQQKVEKISYRKVKKLFLNFMGQAGRLGSLDNLTNLFAKYVDCYAKIICQDDFMRFKLDFERHRKLSRWLDRWIVRDRKKVAAVEEQPAKKPSKKPTTTHKNETLISIAKSGLLYYKQKNNQNKFKEAITVTQSSNLNLDQHPIVVHGGFIQVNKRLTVHDDDFVANKHKQRDDDQVKSVNKMTIKDVSKTSGDSDDDDDQASSPIQNLDGDGGHWEIQRVAEELQNALLSLSELIKGTNQTQNEITNCITPIDKYSKTKLKCLVTYKKIWRDKTLQILQKIIKELQTHERRILSFFNISSSTTPNEFSSLNKSNNAGKVNHKNKNYTTNISKDGLVFLFGNKNNSFLKPKSKKFLSSLKPDINTNELFTLSIRRSANPNSLRKKHKLYEKSNMFQSIPQNSHHKINDSFEKSQRRESSFIINVTHDTANNLSSKIFGKTKLKIDNGAQTIPSLLSNVSIPDAAKVDLHKDQLYNRTWPTNFKSFPTKETKLFEKQKSGEKSSLNDASYNDTLLLQYFKKMFSKKSQHKRSRIYTKRDVNSNLVLKSPLALNHGSALQSPPDVFTALPKPEAIIRAQLIQTEQLNSFEIPHVSLLGAPAANVIQTIDSDNFFQKKQNIYLFMAFILALFPTVIIALPFII